MKPLKKPLKFIRSRKFHLIMTVVWLLLLIPSVTLWKESIVWVVFMSWYANFVTHIDSYTSADE